MKEAKQTDKVNENVDESAFEEAKSLQYTGTPVGADLDLPAELLAELTAEIQVGLKAFSIEQLTSAKSLLGKNITVHDAFIVAFNFGDKDAYGGQRIVFEVSDENSLTYHVAQAPTGSRLTIVNVYNAVRKTQAKLLLTDCEFKEVGKEKFGNRPIVLSPTAATRYLKQ